VWPKTPGARPIINILKYKENLAQYGSLPVPQWLCVFYSGESGTLSLEKAKDMSYFLQPGRPRVSDIECHLENIKEKRPERQQFQNYVIWGKRIWTTRSRQESAAYGQINGIARSDLRSGQSS
jgi:hypothetical protein